MKENPENSEKASARWLLWSNPDIDFCIVLQCFAVFQQDEAANHSGIIGMLLQFSIVFCSVLPLFCCAFTDQVAFGSAWTKHTNAKQNFAQVWLPSFSLASVVPDFHLLPYGNAISEC